MPNHECSITDAELRITLSPEEDPNFINAGYSEPTKQPKSYLQALHYVGDTAYDLARHYVSGSYQDDWVWAGRSSCSYEIDDNGPVYNLPFTPVRGQKVIFKDLNGIRTIGHWYIRNVLRHPYSKRSDGTYRRILEIECEDAWSLMESETYTHVYENEIAGAILKDAFHRAGFDANYIDETAGPLIESFPVDDDYPAAVAEQMMSLLDWSYWLDIQYDPPRPYAGPKESELVRVNLEINEGNVYKIFDPQEFELNPALEDYANEIIFVYRRKYTKGQATVENGTNVILGYSGDEDWYQLNTTDGLEIEFPSTGSVYRIKKNNSDTAGVNEFLLSGNYEEATTSPIDYIVRGSIHKIRRRNGAAIERLKAVRGGTGIRTKKIVRNDAAYTYGEAAIIASFELALFSREYFRGRGLIATSYNADYLYFWPGKTLPFDLGISHQVKGNVRIEGMRRKEIKSRQSFPDGALSPAFEIDLEFTPSLYADTEQIRAILRSTKKLQAVNEIYVTDSEFVDNTLAIKDCVNIVEPITELDPSILEFSTYVDPLVYPEFPAITDLSFTYEPGRLEVTAG